MLNPKEGCGCSLVTMVCLPHSLTAVPAAMLSKGGGSLGFTELMTLRSISNFGKYRAFLVAGVTFLLEKSGMISGTNRNIFLLAVGLVAVDAIVTAIYTLRAGKRFTK